MTQNRYVIRPRAEQDLDDQAFYYATEAAPELGHRFLVSAHETFSLLAKQPHMGWTPRFRHPNIGPLCVFRVSGFTKLLVLYRPLDNGIEVLRVVHGSRNLQAFLRREYLD